MTRLAARLDQGYSAGDEFINGTKRGFTIVGQLIVIVVIAIRAVGLTAGPVPALRL